jgi:hypothetical protein
MLRFLLMSFEAVSTNRLFVRQPLIASLTAPQMLTTIHVAVQTLATRLLRRYTTLVDGAKELEASGKLTREVYLRNIVPVGVLFSVSLILSNWVYLRLSVSFIQMIKGLSSGMRDIH